MDDFIAKLRSLPEGYSEGYYQARRYGSTLRVTADGQHVTFYAEELGGKDKISFNLFILSAGAALRPCEMTPDKVIAFIQGYRPEA